MQSVKPRHGRFEVSSRALEIRHREVDEPQHGVIPGGVEQVVVGLGESHPGRRHLPRLVDPPEQRPRPGLVEERHVVLRRSLPAVLDDAEALVGEPYGTLEPTGAAFELRQIAQNLLAHDVHPTQLVLLEFFLKDVTRLIEPAHPHELEPEHQAGRRIDGAFRPRACGHRDLLQRDGVGQRGRPGVAANELDEREGGDGVGARDRAGLARDPIDGRSSLSQRLVEIPEVERDPGKVLMDPGQEFGIVAGLGASLFAWLPDPVDEVHPAHRCEAVEDLRPFGTRGGLGDRLAEQTDGPGCVAGVEAVLGGVQPAASQRGDVVRTRHPTREVRKVGGRVRSSSHTGPSRGLIECQGNFRVGPVGAKGEVPGTFLRVARQRGESDVERTSLAKRRIYVDGRGQQGVREPDPTARPLDDAGTLGAGEGRDRPLARTGDLQHQLPGGLRRGGDREQGLVGRWRQRGQP